MQLNPENYIWTALHASFCMQRCPDSKTGNDYMDQLTISSLSVLTKIGVHKWEQAIDQRLLIDITIPTDVSNCQDELINTIDYDKLCQQVTTYVESNQFALIETVAERVAQLIKNEFMVNTLTVRVAKPQAIKNAANVAITVTR